MRLGERACHLRAVARVGRVQLIEQQRIAHVQKRDIFRGEIFRRQAVVRPFIGEKRAFARGAHGHHIAEGGYAAALDVGYVDRGKPAQLRQQVIARLVFPHPAHGLNGNGGV